MASNDIEKSRFQSMLEWYQENRFIRALVQLLQIPLGPISIGFGGAIDVVLVRTLENIRSERAKAFFDELAKNNVQMDESLLQSEDFLHCYFTTAKYAFNTRRREKIQMFARLLKSSVTGEGSNGVDEYEDFLKILDELSYRELRALKILDEFSDRERMGDQNDAEWTITFWGEFIQRISNELNIPSDEVVDFLKRLSRTGCYELLIGFFAGGNEGKLTPTYRRLKQFIFESSEA